MTISDKSTSRNLKNNCILIIESRCEIVNMNPDPLLIRQMKMQVGNTGENPEVWLYTRLHNHTKQLCLYLFGVFYHHVVASVFLYSIRSQSVRRRRGVPRL